MSIISNRWMIFAGGVLLSGISLAGVRSQMQAPGGDAAPLAQVDPASLSAEETLSRVHTMQGQMKKTEGEAIDLGEDYDDKLPGLRFVAEGGLYKLRGNLIVRGSYAWVPYAGTLRSAEIDADELRLAERARENTMPGVDGVNAASLQ